jgi:hypothetical protein
MLRHSRCVLVSLLALAFALPGCASKRSEVSISGCGDVAKTGQLNVLTLNMLFDAPAQARHNSWVDIANFASANNVHVLFLQEGVLSDVDRIQRLLGTSNSARDLQQILNQRAAEPYNLRIAWETGVPWS